MLEILFILLVLFQIKHFAADFPLQTQYMLGKFKKDNWILPLSAHAAVNAFITLTIALAFSDSFYVITFVTLVDFITHFIMDRIKASPDLLGKWKPTDTMFWNVVGIDQMVHHLTHYFIIYLIITRG